MNIMLGEEKPKQAPNKAGERGDGGQSPKSATFMRGSSGQIFGLLSPQTPS